jgi:hypothetical protein
VSITDLYPLGVLSPSLPDVRDRPYPGIPAAVGAAPSTVFLPTKEQTFQGRQNSCLPHTATQLMEDDIWMRMGVRTDLSIPFVYKEGRRYHGWQDSNTGMWFRDAINVCRTFGVPPSLLMPYDPNEWKRDPSQEAYDAAKRNRAAEFYKVSTSQDLVGALASGNPVGVCLLVHENVDDFGSTGRWVLPEGKQLGAHAYVVDGFDESGSYAPDGDLWFLGKNWWERNPDGTPWGVPHPLYGTDDRFVKHSRGRVWLHSSVIDSAASFDCYAVLKFPLEE